MLLKFEHQRLFSGSCHSHFKTQQSSNDYISSLCKQNLFKQALHAFDFVRNNTRFCISLSTYARLMLASSSLNSLEHGRRVPDHLTGSNSRADVVLHNHVLNMFGKCGSLADARKVFDEMPERNVVSWTSMIAGYSQKHQEEEAVKFYFGMRHSGLLPDQFAFGSVIRACSGMVDVELGRQLHGHVVKSEFGTHSIIQNALVAMYSKFDRIDDAVGEDLISWGSMIAGFAQQGSELETLSIFKGMLELGVYSPNEFVFGCVFSACSGLLQLEHGKQMHGLSIKFGL